MNQIDAKYVIICSRGPGSETIVTNIMYIVQKDDGKYYYDEDRIVLDDPEDKIDTNPIGIDETFNGIDVAYFDEGPVFMLKEGMSDEQVLGALYQCFKEEEEMHEIFVTENEEMNALFKEMYEARKEGHTAFVSAVIRSFLYPNAWTSCHAWRKLEIEIMSKEQVDRYMEFTKLSLDDLKEVDCKVLNECARLYPDDLPTKNARGC